MRVPSPFAFAGIRDGFVLFPENRDERHLGLDKSSSQQQTHRVDRRTVCIARGCRFRFDVECLGRFGGQEQMHGPLLVFLPLRLFGGAIQIAASLIEFLEHGFPRLELR